MAMIRMYVHYSGQVQGVGFRYTVSNIARGYDVTGTVKNLPDGRVELVVEGNTTTVKSFLEEITTTMGHYIRHTQTHRATASEQYSNFQISF